MNKKITIILEIIFVIVAIIYYVLAVMIPEYQKNNGSSDGFINGTKYQNMIEIKINNKTDFGVVLDEEGRIYHIFFFDNSSVFLYNQNIENDKLDSSINKIINILIDNDLLVNNSHINIIYNNDFYYDNFQKYWNDTLTKLAINTDNTVGVKSIEDIARGFGIESSNISATLLELDLYSKEFVKDLKENIKLDKETSKEYSNKAYIKIENYINKKGITDLNREDVTITLSMIPINNFYPSSNSWYYVKDSKIYAYIEFIDGNNKFSYCYLGSIDNRKEGACDEEKG